MTQKNIGSLLYGNASSRQLIEVSEVIKLTVEIVSAPAVMTNSLQARFVVKVKLGAQENLIARLLYRRSASSAYTDLGQAREVAFSVAPGSQYVDFKAELLNLAPSDPVPYVWMVDRTVPEVLSVSPVNGAIGIAVRSPIVVTFTKDVLSAPILRGDAVTIQPAVTGTWSGSGRAYTFTPTVDMAYVTTYTVHVSSLVQDAAGNALVSLYNVSFETSQRPNMAPSAPTFDGVENQSHISNGRLRVVFNVPNDVDNDSLHFVVELATDDRFLTGYVAFDSSVPVGASCFTYYAANGTRTSPFPTAGVVPNQGQVVFLSPVSQTFSGEYWVKVFANDRRSL